MQKLDFAAAVDLILQDNPKFDREGYFFLKDVLEFTVGQAKKNRERRGGHVTGQQLLEGVRVYALNQFGPMVVTVFEYWGITRCEDFGEIVYELIRVGLFGKSEQDSIDDFKGLYTFHEAFVLPFRPSAGGRVPNALSGGRARRREAKTSQG